MPKPVTIDKTPELPQYGARVPSERFHVSKLNVRYGEPFGETETDKSLIENLRRGNIVEPFLARPEGNGFGVYVGRRRFLSKQAIGTKAYVVGQDWLVRNITDEEAREESLIDNLDALREEMNPLLRAKSVNALIRHNMIGERAVARRLGVSPSSISEWLKVLELHKPLQDALGKGQMYYNDALTVAKMKIGEVREEELAGVLEKQGRDAFMDELGKVNTGKGKRGIPKGKYLIIRTTFDRAHEENLYVGLEQLAKAKNMEVDAYSKWVLTEHVKSLL